LGTETNITKPENETFAEANVSPHEGKPDDLDNDDISQILSGNKAITGKAVWSANGAAAMQRENAEQNDRQDRDKIEAQEARELAHLAEWNAQKTFVGGVEMTNEEAQEARQHIIDNADHYAYRARMEGRIREGEEEEYKLTAKRINELEDKKGRGISSRDDDQECEKLKHSRIGQAVEGDAAKYHMENQSYKARPDATAEQEKSALKSEGTPVVENKLFQSAPDINDHFKKANTLAAQENDQAIPAPAPKVAATGLAL